MLSNEQLQDLINGKIIGSKYPYENKNEQEIETHIRQLFYRINRILNIVCEAEWDHFGSGYVSFVEFFCCRKEDVVASEGKFGHQEITKKGIIINVSRLAPVFLIGEYKKWEIIRTDTNKVVNGGYSALSGNPKLSNFSKKYELVEHQLEQVLNEFGYKRLDSTKMNQPLPFEAEIPTLYRDQGEY